MQPCKKSAKPFHAATQDILRNSLTLRTDGFQELIENSSYLDLDSLCNVVTNRRDNLSFLYANSRSLAKHATDYKLLLDYIDKKANFDFDILCFVETWLNTNTEHLAEIDGYSHMAKHKTNTSRGGGISVFIKDGIKHKIRNDINFPSCEEFDCLFIEINNSGTHPNSESLLLCVTYSSPSGE
jgi:uncharacterized protein YozE (UPF0346 family)